MSSPNAPIAPYASAPMARPSPPGFGLGVRALVGGFGFVLARPSVWPLAIVPAVVAVTLVSVLGWGGVELVSRIPESALAPSLPIGAGIFAEILRYVLYFGVLVLAFFTGFGLAQPLSGFALERIVRRVEGELGAPSWPETSFAENLVRSVQSVLVALAFAVPVLGGLSVLGLLFPPITIVTVPLKLLASALLAAWDLCDYPLSIRGLPMGERVARVRRHVGAMVGFGVGLALVGLVPGAILFALPAGVAGAARLLVELERWEAANGPPRA